MPIDKPGFS